MYTWLWLKTLVITRDLPYLLAVACCSWLLDGYSPTYGKYMGIIGLEPYSFEMMGSEWDTTSSGVNQQDAQGCGPPVMFVGL